MSTEITFKNQEAFVHRIVVDDSGKAKASRTKVDGVMASKGRWSAWGADNGAALANLTRMLELYDPPRPFQSISITKPTSTFVAAVVPKAVEAAPSAKVAGKAAARRAVKDVGAKAEKPKRSRKQNGAS